jgi:cytochrome c-type biogenesis protein CcmH/NrfG
MPRRLPIVLLSVWPGLAQIWTGQEVLGLILATLFAATLNLAILSRFLWTEAFARGLPAFFASLAALTWLAALGYTLWWLWRCHPARHREAIDGLFREATESYLRGQWDDARRRLEQLLALDETDADALMQLATLYMRTGQADLARSTFRHCQELEGGTKWKWEIGRALAALDAPPTESARVAA